MLAALKDIVDTMFSPLGLLAMIFLSGIALSFVRRFQAWGWRLMVCGSGLFLFFVFTPFAEIIYANLEHPYPPMLRAEPVLRTIVVLGGYGEDIPFLPVTSKLSVETIARVTEGVRLQKQLPDARMIMSGGVLRHGDAPLATLMADFAQAVGVPADRIFVETTSTTTYENLLEVRKIVGAEPFILVTSSAELRRAEAVARKLGMNARPAPAAIWASRYYPAELAGRAWFIKFVSDSGSLSDHRLGYLQRAAHEYLGYFWYWMLGRV